LKLNTFRGSFTHDEDGSMYTVDRVHNAWIPHAETMLVIKTYAKVFYNFYLSSE